MAWVPLLLELNSCLHFWSCVGDQNGHIGQTHSLACWPLAVLVFGFSTLEDFLLVILLVLRWSKMSESVNASEERVLKAESEGVELCFFQHLLVSRDDSFS